MKTNKIENIYFSKTKIYEKFFPDFKSIIIPSRTETIDSDIIINRNGRIKKSFF